MLPRVVRISHAWLRCVAATVDSPGNLPLHNAAKNGASLEVVQALLTAHEAGGTEGEESRSERTLEGEDVDDEGGGDWR